MTKRVTSETITGITRAAAENAPDGPAPTPEELLEGVLNKLDRLADPDDKLTSTHITAEQAAVAAIKIRDIRDDMPAGMAFKTVAYSKVPLEESRGAYAEFRARVRPQFFKHLADNNAEQLRNMGICDNGIARMAKGLDPADKNGRVYEVSVDHIIERAGAGTICQKKSIDPDMLPMPDGEGFYETHEINHVGNLILLPNTVHFECKNILNQMQELGEIQQPGAFQWTVMLVPERTENAPHLYVAAEHQKDKYGVRQGQLDVADQVKQIRHDLSALDERLSELHQGDHSVGDLISAFKKSAGQQYHRPLGDILNLQEEILEGNEALTMTPIKHQFAEEMRQTTAPASQEAYAGFVKDARGICEAVKATFSAAKIITTPKAIDRACKSWPSFLALQKHKNA